MNSIKRIVKQYRNMNDFVFGSLYIREGHNRIYIHGRQKKTPRDALFMVVEWI